MIISVMLAIVCLLLWLRAGGKLVTLFSAPDYPQVRRMHALSKSGRQLILSSCLADSVCLQAC
jgi:hypothetical protein